MDIVSLLHFDNLFIDHCYIQQKLKMKSRTSRSKAGKFPEVRFHILCGQGLENGENGFRRVWRRVCIFVHKSENANVQRARRTLVPESGQLG